MKYNYFITGIAIGENDTIKLEAKVARKTTSIISAIKTALMAWKIKYKDRKIIVTQAQLLNQ